MFTAGRYEYRNKGVDMFIESLARRYLHLFNVANLISVSRLELPVTESRIYRYCRCLYHHACCHSLIHHRGSQGPSRYQTAPRHRHGNSEPYWRSTFRSRRSVPWVRPFPVFSSTLLQPEFFRHRTGSQKLYQHQTNSSLKKTRYC